MTRTTTAFKKSTAVLTALALLGAVPGLPFYHAAAQTVVVGQGARGAFAPAPGLPVRFEAGPVQLGQPGLPLAGGSISAAPVPGAQGLTQGAAAGLGVQGLQAADDRATSPEARAVQAAQALERLSADAPDFGKLGTAETPGAAASDFFKRTAQAFRSIGSGEPALGVYAAPRGATFAHSKDSKGKGSKKSMPEQPGHLDGESDGPGIGIPDPDGSLNPRQQDDGPDSRNDEPSRGGSNPVLFSIALGALLIPALALAASAAGMSVTPMMLKPVLAVYGILLTSVAVTKTVQALAATLLGDPTPREKGRLFNPLSHLDGRLSGMLPIGTIVGAMVTGGMAVLARGRHLPLDYSKMRFPRLGRVAIAALAPMVHLGIAAAGIAAFAGVASESMVLLGIAVVQLNMGVALFEALFVAPAVLRAVLTGRAAALYDRVEAWTLATPWRRLLVTGGVAALTASFIHPVAMGLSDWLQYDVMAPAVEEEEIEVGGAVFEAGMSKLAAAGLFFGLLSPKSATASKLVRLPDAPRMATFLSGAMERGPGRSKLLVEFPEGARFKRDYHVDWVDWSQPNALFQFQESVTAMVAQLDKAGLAPEELEAFGAAPVANYRQIRTATLSVPDEQKAALEARLVQLGLKVHQDKVRSIIRPVDPDDARGNPQAKDVTLAEVVQITGADKVQAILKKELESSVDAASLRVPSFAKGLTLRLLKALGVLKAPVNAPGSVIDTGVDKDHPMLKGTIVRDGRDGHGHGTWVASAVTSYDPYQKNLRAYNTFTSGSATTDDILRDYTAADNEGAEWFTNSWGDSYGDPDAPEAKLVRAVAEKGKIQFFAAGNQGPGDNTVGGPAIAFFKDPKTGAMIIVSVGATDSDAATAWFQSRGPHSPYFESKPEQAKEYPNRVDIQSVGHRVYGAYPTYLRGADRTDPKLGPQKRSSGTSMSTPTTAGAYSLLREFGFAPVAIVKALLETAKPTGKPEAEGGKGFMDVYAAYQALKKAEESTLGAKLRRLAAKAVVPLVAAKPASTAVSGPSKRVDARAGIVAGLLAGLLYPSVAFAAGPVTVAAGSIGGAVLGFAAGFFYGMKTVKGGGDFDFSPLVWIFYGAVGAAVGAIGGAVLASVLG